MISIRAGVRRHVFARIDVGVYARRTFATAPKTHSANVLDELNYRGFIADITSRDLHKHLEAPSCVYAGVDPSASSLHVGNLVPLLALLHFRARGHHALALIGGATGSIGDPSGRSAERNALSKEELAHNVAGITAQVERFFERGIEYASKKGYGQIGGSSGKEVTVVNNYDWFKDVSFLDFLRDVGKLARVNTMLARESVKSRLDSESGISFTEFSYQLLQAHDFATLYKTHACRVQIGGSDQWGNIVAGIDLIKRQRAKEERDITERPTEPAFGLTIPLLTTSTGEKFGKSAGNAVWLDTARTSVSDFYQFFFRTQDADVGKYLNLLTLVPSQNIAEALRAHEKTPRERFAQRLLAREVTELVHGPRAVKTAELIAKMLFQTASRDLKASEVLETLEGDPRLVRVSRRDLKGLPVSKLAVKYGLVGSRSEANRMIKPRNTGMTLNDTPVSDPRREIVRTDLIDKHIAILRRGNKEMIVFYVED